MHKQTIYSVSVFECSVIHTPDAYFNATGNMQVFYTLTYDFFSSCYCESAIVWVTCTNILYIRVYEWIWMNVSKTMNMQLYEFLASALLLCSFNFLCDFFFCNFPFLAVILCFLDNNVFLTISDMLTYSSTSSTRCWIDGWKN